MYRRVHDFDVKNVKHRSMRYSRAVILHSTVSGYCQTEYCFRYVGGLAIMVATDELDKLQLND